MKRESEVTQSCLTLYDPIDGSPPGSSVHGILQAVLEWGAITFSEIYVYIHVNIKIKLFFKKKSLSWLYSQSPGPLPLSPDPSLVRLLLTADRSYHQDHYKLPWSPGQRSGLTLVFPISSI